VTTPTIVGVVNITPDSFSDGGNFFTPAHAVAQVEQLFDTGADLVELGGESTRPGATPVSADEELSRILPVLRAIVAKRPNARIAIDTVKSTVAAEALREGATLINDVSALRLDPAMATVCAHANCTVVLMHSRGTVNTMARYDHAEYTAPVMTEILAELRTAVVHATSAGIDHANIILDPGIGFAKTPAQSLSALAHLPQLVNLGFPVMIGASRKRFIGEITGMHQPQDRDAGSVGAHVTAFMAGASWFRVHNVRAHRHALDVAFAIRNATHTHALTEDRA
jgi:dihydropteroate synthase